MPHSCRVQGQWFMNTGVKHRDCNKKIDPGKMYSRVSNKCRLLNKRRHVKFSQN